MCTSPQLHGPWLNKCIQLYETYLVRHGIMLVGPAGSGKSMIAECLADALTELGTKHVIWRMNPKAITAPQVQTRPCAVALLPPACVARASERTTPSIKGS